MIKFFCIYLKIILDNWLFFSSNSAKMRYKVKMNTIIQRWVRYEI